MAKLSFSQFIASQWTHVPPVPNADLTGKTLIVVGANTGIGLEASKHFAKMNPGKLILACRNQEKGDAAVEKIREETGCENVELWMIDLSDFSSVIAFANKFEKEPRLDILVENAGIFPTPEFTPTKDGWEPALQINYLSLSLLGLLLLPKLISTAEEFKTLPRLVVVSSEVHYLSTFEKSLLEGPNPLRTFGSRAYCTPEVIRKRYNDTKLLEVFFVRALNERLQSVPVIVDCVNPGYCYSDLRRNFTGIMGAVDWVMEKSLARTAEEGSRQLIWAAIGDEDGDPDKLRGSYITLNHVEEPNDFVLGDKGHDAQEILWNDLIKELSNIDLKVRGIVDQYLTEPVSID